MSSVDPLGAFRAYVAARTAGTVLDGIPLRGGNLDPGDEPPAVLLMEAGGTHQRSVPWQSTRIEVFCYGPLGPAGPRIASELYRAVAGIAHGAGPFTVGATTVARMFEEMGPQPMVDATTRWAVVYGVFDLEMPDRSLGGT